MKTDPHLIRIGIASILFYATAILAFILNKNIDHVYFAIAIATGFLAAFIIVLFEPKN